MSCAEKVLLSSTTSFALPIQGQRDDPFCLQTIGEELLKLIRDVGIETPAKHLSAKEITKIDLNQYSPVFKKYGKQYLRFCEAHIDMAKNRAHASIWAHRNQIKNIHAVHTAVALETKQAGSLELCSLISVKSREKNLYPIIFTLCPDVKGRDHEASHEVLLLSTSSVQENVLGDLSRRVGRNFYSVIKQMKETLLVDPLLGFLIPSDQLETHREYKQLISLLKGTKISGFQTIEEPYEHLHEMVEKVRQGFDSKIKKQSAFYHPGALNVRNSWFNETYPLLTAFFFPMDIFWTRAKCSMGLQAIVPAEQGDAIMRKFQEVEIEYFEDEVEVNGILRTEISIDCIEISSWRALHEKLSAHLQSMAP